MTRLTEAEIERLLSRLAPSWEPVGTRPADSGGLAVVHCAVETADGRRDCVLKANDRENAHGVEREARLLPLLAERTTIPVPELHGVLDADSERDERDTSDLPQPAMLVAEMPGEPLQRTDLATLRTREVTTIAREVGAWLAQLHAIEAVDAYGFLKPADGRRAGSVPPAVAEAIRVVDPESDWRTRLAAFAEQELSGLQETRFAPLHDRVAPALRSRVERVEGPFRPVLARIDASPENHSWNGERVTGLFDWAFTIAATPGYDLAHVAGSLAGGHWSLLPDGVDRSEAVWDALLAGYEDAEPAAGNPLQASPAGTVVGSATDGTRLTTDRIVAQARANRDAYDLLRLVRTGVLFDGWFDWWGVEGERRETAADTLREWLDAAV